MKIHTLNKDFTVQHHIQGIYLLIQWIIFESVTINISFTYGSGYDLRAIFFLPKKLKGWIYGFHLEALMTLTLDFVLSAFKTFPYWKKTTQWQFSVTHVGKQTLYSTESRPKLDHCPCTVKQENFAKSGVRQVRDRKISWHYKLNFFRFSWTSRFSWFSRKSRKFPACENFLFYSTHGWYQ